MLRTHWIASPAGSLESVVAQPVGTSSCCLPLVASAFLAFVARELATYASYKAKVALGLASLAVSLVTFSFVGKVVAGAGSGFVEQNGMSYTSFALIGIFVHSIAGSGLHSFKAAVRREQLQGTLELMLATRLPSSVLVFLAGAGDLVVTVLGGTLLMACAAALIGLKLSVSPESVAAALLYLVVMCGIGMASAGIIIVSKEGEPVSWAVGAASGLLGGVYFPVPMLPGWLQGASRVLPTTHALTLARYGSQGSAGFGAAGSLGFLAAAALASLAVGLTVLEWGCRRARSSGILSHY
jgi:ABC-2 type transport system permease protein